MGLLRANGIEWQGSGPTLAAVHRPGWFRQRRFAAYLAFALCILSAATIAFFEWEMLRAETPERPGELLRWIYLPLAFLTISLVLFVRLHWRASRRGAVERDVAGQLVGRLLESMPSAVVVTDDRGSIRLANAKAQAMFRYSSAQLIGIRIEALISASSRSAYADECQTLARCGQPSAAAELSAVRSDGSGIDVEIGLAPIDVGGERLTVVTINDIGERKRLEREAALQRDELAHLSRTASLSALSSSLAHELIQPLTAILSNAQAGTRFLAHQPCNIEAGRASLDSVVDNAKRASDVIRKLRSMLRKGESELVPLDINDVVHDIMQVIRSEMMERHVRVVLELAEGLPKVRGDRVHLQQVMMNLMMNAADAMSGGSRSRRLTIRTIAVDAGDLEVQVEDTGTGIAQGDLERIFAPFVTSKPRGMGLGLSVCAMLIEAHAGKLWATNNDGEGATLHFRLPPSAENTKPRHRSRAGVAGARSALRSAALHE